MILPQLRFIEKPFDQYTQPSSKSSPRRKMKTMHTPSKTSKKRTKTVHKPSKRKHKMKLSKTSLRTRKRIPKSPNSSMNSRCFKARNGPFAETSAPTETGRNTQLRGRATMTSNLIPTAARLWRRMGVDAKLVTANLCAVCSSATSSRCGQSLDSRAGLTTSRLRALTYTGRPLSGLLTTT